MTNAKETFLKYLMIKPALALQIQNCFFLKFQSNYITIALQFIPLWFLPITSAVYSCIWILNLKTWEMYHFTSKPVDVDIL